MIEHYLGHAHKDFLFDAAIVAPNGNLEDERKKEKKLEGEDKGDGG